MENKGLMGGLYKITEWITRIFVSNLLWLVCSIPFLFIGFTKLLLLAQSPNQTENLTLWLMAILAPFTLFPATAALFALTRKWIMGDPDVPIFKTYFKAYKENYKYSMIGGVFYTLLTVIMIIDYKVYMTQLNNTQVIGMVMLVFLLLILVSMFNFFSTLVHYHMTIVQVIKNSILLTLVRPFRVFSTVLIVIVLGMITYRFPVFIVVGFASLTACVAFFNFYGTYMKMQLKAEQLREAREAGLSDTEDKGTVK
ncbi:putative membrane protein YesL [Paenibacillus shirakamiensis]|uniref:Membrane protein YesL n=1 Tax=Paenibacillus shirakamiensis TaxID=1265935 RepID=A0ABS4JHU7_9BACL|nr:DUF624 domain-containing protein [Paenibacillus shirakamiensis]MBP2001290.1 putative membrane protein YesL [Paenibacillus shirakamiensis]